MGCAGLALVPASSTERDAMILKHKPRWNGYGSKDSERIILNLHQIEKQIRKEIRDTQIFRWTPAMILERWPDGRA